MNKDSVAKCWGQAHCAVISTTSSLFFFFSTWNQSRISIFSPGKHNTNSTQACFTALIKSSSAAASPCSWVLMLAMPISPLPAYPHDKYLSKKVGTFSFPSPKSILYSIQPGKASPDVPFQSDNGWKVPRCSSSHRPGVIPRACEASWIHPSGSHQSFFQATTFSKSPI